MTAANSCYDLNVILFSLQKQIGKSQHSAKDTCFFSKSLAFANERRFHFWVSVYFETDISRWRRNIAEPTGWWDYERKSTINIEKVETIDQSVIGAQRNEVFCCFNGLRGH